MGKLMEKQAELAIGRKIQKIIKPAGKSNTKTGRKQAQNEQIYTKHTQISFCNK